ncbi:MAG TPA: STN domain-containing protein, partial [Chitinophagaceae bacterium]|nr:STN domain-containing protein [Chitinophagaceae bacterium]
MMRSSCLGLLLALFSLQMAVALPADSQNLLNKTVDFTVQNQTLEEALHKLHLETGVAFIYSSRESMNKIVVLTVENKTVKDVLDRLFKGSLLSYDVIGSKVVIHQKEKEKANVVKEAP